MKQLEAFNASDESYGQVQVVEAQATSKLRHSPDSGNSRLWMPFERRLI